MMNLTVVVPETQCHACEATCELGLEDDHGHTLCETCFDDMMEAWADESNFGGDIDDFDGLDAAF